MCFLLFNLSTVKFTSEIQIIKLSENRGKVKNIPMEKKKALVIISIYKQKLRIEKLISDLCCQ